ncbi:putative beta-ketoacyl-acyl carrier protein synthase III [Toxoplasma gondii TgCatPRC2]|uniref:Putative beta-ketoacyl-acyl carrier protein synthase III n=1 Tax=Toxoplasma gondii TgCatPRC2 TaxID=1130821 RepID=A0A151H336_TOXGO|nr:putative beta-ketoacyl-acyl carrier protein synthase III [Toxoplasma gondii TgCatPRC2]
MNLPLCPFPAYVSPKCRVFDTMKAVASQNHLVCRIATLQQRENFGQIRESKRQAAEPPPVRSCSTVAATLARTPSSFLARFFAGLSPSLGLLFSVCCLLLVFSRHVLETSGFKATPVQPPSPRPLSVRLAPSGGVADLSPKDLRVSVLPFSQKRRLAPLFIQIASTPLEISFGAQRTWEAEAPLTQSRASRFRVSALQARSGAANLVGPSHPLYAVSSRQGHVGETRRSSTLVSASSFLSPRVEKAPQESGKVRRTDSPSALFDASASPGEQTPGAVSFCGTVGCRIIGVGSAVPTHEMTNDDMAEFVETSDEWIRTRTGIRSRRVLSTSESLRSLAVDAARRALENAKLKASDIDLVLHASSSPDDLFGDATSIAAGIVQAERSQEGSLQESDAFAGPAGFDLTAACSGFLVGLITGNAFLTSPCCPYKRILVVGADALTRWVDWTDRNTCVLFGDGAGAVVLERQDAKTGSPAVGADPDRNTRRGILSYMLNSDGLQAHQLTVPFSGTLHELKRAGGKPAVRTSQGRYAPLSMNGREVFKFVSRKVPPAIEAVVQAAGLTTNDVDWLLLHQANKRIMDAVAERLKMPLSKVLCNLDKYGNTSAASIPLCLDEAVREGKVKPGDIVVTAGFGAGLTWSAAVFRYG